MANINEAHREEIDVTEYISPWKSCDNRLTIIQNVQLTQASRWMDPVGGSDPYPAPTTFNIV